MAGRLTLTRRPAQRVLLRLGDVQVWVTVIDVDRNKVRIQFDAPQEVVILREELLEESNETDAS